MNKKKVKKCPLKPNDWISTIISDQNQVRNVYYSNEMSIFTKSIIILTISSIVFMIISILQNLDNISNELKSFSFVIGCFYLVIIILLLIRYFNYLKDIKLKIKEVNKKQDEILVSIIDGELTNSNEIRERYKEIDIH